MSHHRHGHHGKHGAAAPPYSYGAPGYNYNPLQQTAPAYGQQIVPAYGQQVAVPTYGQQQHGSSSGYGVPYGGQQQVTPYQAGSQEQNLQYLRAEEKRHRQNEHRAGVGALGALAFAAYEKHEEKVDPAHAHRHHVEAQIAEAAALGLGGYALHERHEAHKIKKQEKKLSHHHGKHRH